MNLDGGSEQHALEKNKRDLVLARGARPYTPISLPCVNSK